MAKRFLLVLSGIIFMTQLQAQQEDGQYLKKHYLRMYNQALVYNDVNAAIGALHGYLAEDNSIAYKDTLSVLYFTTRQFYSSLLLAEEVYKSAPDNIVAMARAAECYDELGEAKTAIGLYEQVCPKIKNPYYYYKLALAQYQLKRTAESELSAKIVIADTMSKKIGINFTNVDGTQQAIPVNAAAANLLGVMQMDLKNYDQAKLLFKQAVAFFPQFAGASQNLQACEEKTKTPGKPATPKKPGK
ncbi:MAG: hypothetical protein IPP73_07105 [Chitinophagaceae bacterium]|nr:hypothetical protein [Chitinophagaceae bacterium]